MQRKLGIWIFGARGAVATCAMMGVHAIKRGLCSKAGLLTETPACAKLELADLEGLAFGGPDIRPDVSAFDCAMAFHDAAGVPPYRLVRALAGDLAAVDPWVKAGTAVGCGEAIRGLARTSLEDDLTLAETAERIRADMRAFETGLGLDAVVAVNLTSTEPYSERAPACMNSLRALERAITQDRRDEVSAGVLYAYATVGAGYPYVNFTPSLGADVPAIEELARNVFVPCAGKDGKTGETLMKTALAPMFVARAFQVMSWEGYNLFGNGDARILDHPQNNLAKTRGKDAALREILGEPAELHTRVRIDHVPSLDDWKTAWDFVHFRGFMDTRMVMQFIWQGCDSMLAAPLVIDLARLIDHAQRAGRVGDQSQLACFFKSPSGGGTHDFFRQFARLQAYLHEVPCMPAEKSK